MPVVEVIPERQGGAPLVRVGVGVPVGPFAQGGLDESFGLAVGLGPVGAGEFLADAQGAIGGPEGVGSEGRAVVGDQTLDGNAQPGEVLGGGLHEAHGALLSLIGIDLGEGDPVVVIDGDEQAFPADVAAVLGAVTSDPVAAPFEAAALLDVDVQQLARRLALVALHRRLRLEVAREAPTYAAIRA